MRPKHPHAAESGVGKHTARESERVQACAAGKERVTSAHPHKLAPEASKTSGAFFVFRAKCRAAPREMPRPMRNARGSRGRQNPCRQFLGGNSSEANSFSTEANSSEGCAPAQPFFETAFAGFD
jgi:hypothetical protein